MTRSSPSSPATRRHHGTLPCPGPVPTPPHLGCGPVPPRPAPLLVSEPSRMTGAALCRACSGRQPPAEPAQVQRALPWAPAPLSGPAAGRPGQPSSALPARTQQQQATSLPWPRTSRWRRPEVQDDVFTVLPPIVNPLPFHRLNSVSSDSSCVSFIILCSTQ